jgi:carboxylesterase type B
VDAGTTVSTIFAYRYNVRDEPHAASGLGVPHLFEAAAVFGPGSLPQRDVAASYYSYNAPVVPLVRVLDEFRACAGPKRTPRPGGAGVGGLGG